MFDSPLLFFIFMKLEGILFSTSLLLEKMPKGMTDANGIIWIIVLGVLEVVYYRYGKRNIRIINKFEAYDAEKLKKSKQLSYQYVFSVLLLGGIGLLFY